MWICKRCGTQNGTRFCNLCGAKRPDAPNAQEEFPNAESRASDYGARVCAHCGAKMPEGLRFCQRCGADQGKAAQAAQIRLYDDEPEEPRRMSFAYILGCVLAGAVCVAAIVACVFMLFGNPFVGAGDGTAAASPSPLGTALPSTPEAGQDTPQAVITPSPRPGDTPSAAPTVAPTTAPTVSPTARPTATPTAKPSPTPADEDAWLEALVLEGDDRYYSEDELTDMTKYQLMILRNGMFALSGKRFTRNQEVMEFFSACSWYTPLYDSDTDAREHMNDYQKKNLSLIIDVETDKGYR